MKSTFWQWLTNPKAEEVNEVTMVEPTTTHMPTKPVGVWQIALGVYCGLLMITGTACVLWFVWTVLSDAARR